MEPPVLTTPAPGSNGGTNPGFQAPNRKKRLEDHSVTFKQVVYALPFLGVLLTTVGGFVINQANAQGAATAEKVKVLEAKLEARDAGLREELRQVTKDFADRHHTTEQKVERTEAKIDDVKKAVDEVLKELRRQRR